VAARTPSVCDSNLVSMSRRDSISVAVLRLKVAFRQNAHYCSRRSQPRREKRHVTKALGVRFWAILCSRSVRHAAREVVLKGRSIYWYGTLRWRPNTDYALSRSSLRNNFVKNPAQYKLGVIATFPARTPVDYLSRRVRVKARKGHRLPPGRWHLTGWKA
jgi:hypothetical protein